MEIQKFRIKRINPDIYWDIPCSGGTNFWPINTSTNCSGITMYNSSGIDVMSAINGDILNSFPEELKHCSPTDPCVILWNTGPASSPNHCTSPDGFLYVLFKGLNVTLSGITYTDSYDLTESVISVGQASISPVNITPNTFGCECPSALGENLNKIPIFISQDFNDIGHYTVWDGNISQQEVFANFVFSGVSSGGMGVLVSNTTDFGYYETFQKSQFTIDWGEFGNTTQILYYPSLTTQSIYTYTNPGKYTITITQDTPWGPISTSKVIVVPLETYAVMAGSPISPLNPTLQMDQANPLLGPQTFDVFGNPSGFQGSSTAYFNSYPNMPLDSATHINEYSGMTFGAGSQGGEPCFTVSGITDSILGNFQTYTSSNTPNLPPGYNAGVTVPIGGDVLDPITETFLTGVYGVIDFASSLYTAYTISSAANSTGTADGDTPVRFWDFNNGITIFEATSCGLDNLAWGAEECIACPSGDCEYCTTKDEYVDRVTGIPHSIGPGVVVGDWSPSGNYSIGDIVYDVTFNSCCCYMAVTNISSSDPWFGVAPVMMEEGTYNDAGVYTHVWEACSPDCVSCPPGTNTPCNDYSLTSFVYSPGAFYNAGDFVEGEYGNCYQALVSGTLDPPTGYTMQYTTEWDYIGCVSWICPTEGPEANCDSDCITAPPINGVWSVGQMNSAPFGWLGGPYQQGFNFYFENDTVTYNGVCYLCTQSNIGPDFPCSYYYGSLTPDLSPYWQACPLATAQNLECIMISGATLDTFDQFGFPITVTGEMFWADCQANLSGGTCFENRWKCIDQYSCLGCEPIDSSDPLYFTPLSFANEADCIEYCEPPAYSCTTPTAIGTNCCSEINCFLNSVQYVSTMISVGAASSTPIDLAYNHGLFLAPTYSMNDCNNGVLSNTMNNSLVPPVNIAPQGPILECCIDTVWLWNCEDGCMSMGGIPSPGPLTVGSEDPQTTFWANSADCESNVLLFYGVSSVVGDVACSWWCEDPFLPYVAPTPGPYQSPCIPCYSLSACPPVPIPLPGGAGPYATEADCVTGCSQTASCVTCDCTTSPPCFDTTPQPCPTLISTNPDVYGFDPNGGLNGIPSYATIADCLTACTCNFGWDCFTDTGQTPTVNVGCQQGISVTNIQALNWMPSDPDPNFTGYSSYSACCYANEGCCYAKCDDDPSSNLNSTYYPPTGIPSPLGDWPCSYEISLFVQPGPPNGCNDPTVFGYVYDPNKPWCFMFDCTNALCSGATTPHPTCCDPQDETCDCACLPPVNSMGAWNSLFPGYDRNDAVYWGDTDTDFCCFKCHCDYLGAPFTPGDPTTYDCNHFTPGDPAHMGVPNCWRSCNQTPGDPPIPFPWQGTLYNPCSACTSDFDPGYSCTPDGCQNIGCNPMLGTGHLFNCYTSSNCDDFGAPECEAQCYCPPQVGGAPCVSDCITLQQELISGVSPVPTDCPPNSYIYTSYNECMGINPVNVLLPDCCPKPQDQWYCDDSSNCNSNYPPVVNVDGTGCVQISTGHPLYQDPITTNFTSLADCQADCSWCCDPNGVSVCTFVGNVANCLGTTYIDALQCYLATTTNTPCDCSIDPTEFWCHYDYPNNVGGCVSNIMGLSDTNLFGTGNQDRATDPTAFFTSLLDCQQACKFCCDCDITGECYLNWYCTSPNPGGGYGCDCHDCYDYLADCAANEEPCVVLPPDYYCDDILGCTTYPIVNTLVVGPFTGPTALADCQEQCQFECNLDCECEVTTIPVNPVQTPPCYTLACCHIATVYNARCCECEKCLGDHPYSYDNGMGTLLTYWITITSVQLTNVQNWNSTGPYSYGDVVTQDGCCYIMVLNTGDWAFYDTTMLPLDYYNLYMNVLNTTGLPVYGQDLMWIPCDPHCPPVVYEERWWCDDNNPSYPYQETNCIQEYPWINNQISSNPAYGDFVYGTDGSGNQVSYNNGGSPFSSLAQCQEYCKYCCEPEPDPAGPCCCCEDDGFGVCKQGTSVSYMNPTGLPCDQLCNQNSLIECPPKPCCCCDEDPFQPGVCIPGTQVSMMPVADTPCDFLCKNNAMIECDDSCKICCQVVPGPIGGAYYTVSNQNGHCKCSDGDIQVSLNYCEPIIHHDFDGSGHGSGHQDDHDTSLLHKLHSGNPAEKAKIKQAHSGPQPCCIDCQTPGGMVYQVSQAVGPCKCAHITHINLGPCQPVIAQSGPCELDWRCGTCEHDCYDSYYSCMTLTNDCTPPDPADCQDCVGTYAEWDYNQDGLFGYYSPITAIVPPRVNNAISTYDGWDGVQIIPNSSPVTWTSAEPYWNFGQIVLDSKTPGCCWIRNEFLDDNTVPNLPPDQYSPSQHWCNFLSGNSADGANMYSPPGGTIITQQMNSIKVMPWWIPCDKNCVDCDTGGTQTLRYKCIDGASGGVGCTGGYFPWNDPHTFDNLADCNEWCWSWLCNSNGYFTQYSKCNSNQHIGVVGDFIDFINYFIQHGNPNLIAMNYVFTYVPPVSYIPYVLPVGSGFNPLYPCPILPPDPNATGYESAPDSYLLTGLIMNCGNPCSTGGASCGNAPSISGPSWFDVYTNCYTFYNTKLIGCNDFQCVLDVMENSDCKYTPPASIPGTPCASFPLAGTLADMTPGAEKYNDSGLFFDTTNVANPCQVYDISKSGFANDGCCLSYQSYQRPCPCTAQDIACDCWQVMGTGTTGGPFNIFDVAHPPDAYTACTSDCCVGTCECCEPNLKAAGYILPTDSLTWQGIGMSSFSVPPATMSLSINECMIFPDGNIGPGGSSTGPDLSGLWNIPGVGTLSGGCCVCCVAGGSGTDPDPLNDGNPSGADCFFKTDASNGIGGQSGGWDSVNFYDYTGQWVSCGVDELCENCGSGGVVPLV